MSKRTFRYLPNPETGEIEAVEVDRDWSSVPRSTGDLGKFQYSNCQTLEGVDISSRTKLNRHLKETGGALAHEFKGEWETAAKKREAYFKGENRSTSERRLALGRELYRKGLIKF